MKASLFVGISINYKASKVNYPKELSVIKHDGIDYLGRYFSAQESSLIAFKEFCKETEKLISETLIEKRIELSKLEILLSMLFG